jgi:glycosyltransferase involved in cell wall biosynthesis
VVDPGKPGQVADALERAHAERYALRAALLERAAEFTWERCAARVEALWEELA